LAKNSPYLKWAKELLRKLSETEPHRNPLFYPVPIGKFLDTDKALEKEFDRAF
jgi:hypothetical protein